MSRPDGPPGFTSSLEAYLTLGLVPDRSRALEYLGRILQPGLETGAPGEQLRRVVEESCAPDRAPHLVLALSGGFDSRLLLGACLAIGRRRDLLCLTCGTSRLADTYIARRTCRRLGIEHQVMNPNRIAWDLDELVEDAMTCHRATGGLPPIDGLVRGRTLRKAAGREATIVSGFLGDAVSGKHLPEVDADDPLATAADFRRFNGALRKAAEPDQVDRALTEALKTAHPLLTAFPGARRYDLFDFGFRQALRIRASTGGIVAPCVRPFEDPRWVACWLGRDGQRDWRQTAYRRFCVEEFPEVFVDLPPASPIHRPWWRTQWGRAVGERDLIPYQESRGDPKRNASMRVVCAALLRELELRGGLAEPAMPYLDAVLRKGDRRDMRRLRWAASAGLYLKCGLLGPGR